MFTLAGYRINIDAGFESNGFNYPAGSLRDPAVRETLGIVEIPEPVKADERFYYNQELDVAPYLVVTPKDLDAVKAETWSRIKAYRDDLQDNGGCLVDGHWYHTDTKSKQQQIALVMLGVNLPVGLQWKTLDGTFVSMTPALAASVFQAQVVREQTVFAVAEYHKTIINAAELVDTLASYDYTVGWPARYENPL
jgi:hypothetical protein